MKSSPCLALLLAATCAHAEVITWTATGTVSSLNGSGFAAGVGNPVSVKVSYQTGLTTNILQELGPFPAGSIYRRTEFAGNMNLKVDVTIGATTWSGEVASDAVGDNTSLYSEAWDGNGPDDKFFITASSQNSGTFPSFPYSGSGTARSIAVTFLDGTVPAQFIQAGQLPMDWSEPAHLNQASGVIQAGTDQINFTLTPGSVKVVTDAPRIPVKFKQTTTGVELRWPGVTDVIYQVQECGALGTWIPIGTYFGSGTEIVVPMQPFATNPIRRFYRVVTYGAL